MELMAVIVMACVGWGHGRFGAREFKGLAIVAFGWTLVITVDALPQFYPEAIALGFVVRLAMVGGAYAVGAGARHLVQRHRDKA